MRLLVFVWLAAMIASGESHLLEGKLENAQDCVRLEWENQDGLRSLIEIGPQWKTLVPLAEGGNQVVVTATYRDGSTKQMAFDLWGSVPRREREIVGQLLFQGRLTPYSIKDGQVVVEDHILLGPAAELLRERAPKGRNEALVIRSEGLRWTNSTVVYQFDPSLPEASRNEFLQATEFWQANTGLRFVPRSNETNFLRVSRLLPDEGICFSNIGMQRGETLMRLADSCSLSTVTHEVGHAIGLYHEHVRADRDSYVSIDVSRAQLDQQSQFNPQISGAAESGPYDFGSLMHYAQFEFGRAGLPVLFTIPRGISVREAKPTAGDLQAVSALYGDVSSGTWVTTNPEGLEMEVDGVKAVSPQRYQWAAGSTHRISVPALQGSGDNRNRFGRWSNDGPLEQTITAGATRIYAAHFVRECRVPAGFPSPLSGGTFTMTPHFEDSYYPCDSEIRFEARPAPGFQFMRWNYRGLGSANPVTVRLGSAFSDGPVRPLFTQRRMVTINSVPSRRSVIVDGLTWTTPVSFDWAEGTRHTVEARDQASQRISYRFSAWSQGGAAAQEVVAGPETSIYTARFTTRFRLSRLTVGNGTLTADPPSADNTYEAGAVVTLRATPAAGGTFRNFYGSVSGTQSPITLTMDDEKAVTANFTLAAPTISASVPESAVAGGPGFSLRLSGTNFIDGLTVVRVNGTVRRVTPQGTTQMEVPIEAADLVGPELNVTVSNATLAPATRRLPLQARGTACELAVERAVVSVDAAGASFAIPASTGANCPWILGSNPSWIEVPPRFVRGGADHASFFVTPNPSAAARTATLRLGNQSIVVNQEGAPCRAVFSPEEVALPAAGGSVVLGVGLYRNECVWNLSQSADWFTAQSETASGMGQLQVQAEANNTVSPRTATLRVAAGNVTVRQPSAVVPTLTRVVSEADLQGGPFGLGSRIIIEVRGLAGADAAGVQVRFGEVAVTPLEATPERLLVLIPLDGPRGDVELRVFNGGSLTEATVVPIAALAPRIYVPLSPANEEGVVTLLVSGFGPAEPLPDLEVSVSGAVAEVLSREVVEAALLRVQFRLPANVEGERRVVVKIGDFESPVALLP